MSILFFTSGLVIGGIVGAKAQTWSEWWQQKKTRLTYMREQVVALEAVEGAIKNSYVQEGVGITFLHFVGQNFFEQDLKFYQDLRALNPLLVDTEVLASRESREKALIARINSRMGQIDELPAGMAYEPDYMTLFLEIINTRVAKQQVMELLKSEQISMDDAGRIEVLNGLVKVLDRYYFMVNKILDDFDAFIEQHQRDSKNYIYLNSILL